MSTSIVAGFNGEVRYAVELTGSGYGAYNNLLGGQYGVTGSYLWIGDVTSCEPDINMEIKELHVLEAGGSERDAKKVLQTRKTAGLKLEYHPKDINYMKRMLYGVTTGSDIVEVRYTGSQFGAGPLLTPQIFLAAGARANTFTVKGEIGEPYTVTAELYAKDIKRVTNITGSSYAGSTDADPYMWSDGTITIGGAAKGNISAWDVTVKNNLERAWGFPTVANTKTVYKIPEKNRAWNGNVTFWFDETTEFDRLVANNSTGSTLVFNLSGSVAVTVYGATWGSTSLPTKPTDLIELKIPFTARSGSIA